MEKRIEMVMAKSDDVASQRPLAWWPLLLLSLSPLLLWECWAVPFLPYDDLPHVQDHPFLAPKTPWHALMTWHKKDCYYQPMSFISLRIDRALWEYAGSCLGLNNAWAMGVRTGNLLLHIGAALAIWAIVRRLGAASLLAGWTAIAFALHPTAVCIASVDFNRLTQQGIVLTVLGQHYAESGRLAEAEACLDRLAKANMGSLPAVVAQAYFVRGLVAEQRGDLNMAIYYYESGITIWPEAHDIRVPQAMVYLKMRNQQIAEGDDKSAADLLHKAMKTLKQVPEWHPDYREAQSWLERLAKNAENILD